VVRVRGRVSSRVKGRSIRMGRVRGGVIMKLPQAALP